MFLLTVFKQICYFPLASVVRRLFFMVILPYVTLWEKTEWSADAETNMFQVKMM